jgi:hypothetical protein
MAGLGFSGFRSKRLHWGRSWALLLVVAVMAANLVAVPVKALAIGTAVPAATPVQLPSQVTPLGEYGSFVNASYQDFLGRAPSASELSVQSNALATGSVSMTNYLRSLATSDEWLRVIVTKMYSDTLGRAPDAAGLASWVGWLRTGRFTVAQVASLFYASDEYYIYHAGNSATTWVTLLYQKLLNRAPDAAGLAGWVSFTNDARYGKSWVAYQFFQSLESRLLRVQGLYQALLYRGPDAVGWPFWAQSVLQTGDITLAINLAGSQEYWQRAQTRFPSGVAAPTIDTSSLPSGTAGDVYSATLIGSGGTTPYSWSAIGLPGGLSLDATTGVISGTATTAGSSSVVVTLTDEGKQTFAKTLNLSIIAGAKPTITSIDPTSGGDTLTITGTNLTGTTKVAVGGLDATNLSVVSATQVTAVAPAHTAGLVDIQLTAPGGTTTKTSGYTYAAPEPAAPTITSISPATGPTSGGNKITITGTNLTGTNQVTIDGTVTTNLTVVNDTTVTATAPAHAAGLVVLVLSAPGGTTNTAGYTYVDGTCAKTVQHVSGDITTNTTWTPDCTSAYAIDTTLTIPSGVTLTVLPGTVVKGANASAGIVVLGTLNATGSSDQPIIFTSISDDTAGGDTNGDGTNTGPGSWGGISFLDNLASGPAGSLFMRWADVREGWIRGAAAQTVSIADSVLTDAFTDPVAATGPITFERNRVIGHPKWSSWTQGTVTLRTSESLRIVDNTVTGSGSLNGYGTQSTTITGNTINSTEDFAGGISSIMPYADKTNGPVTVMNNTVSGSKYYAFEIYAYHLDPAKLTDNAGTNNTINAISLSGHLESDLTLSRTGLPIVIGSGETIPSIYQFDHTYGLVIDPGVTLTVLPGTVVKGANASAGIVVLGTLNATGSSDQPIIFTSISDDTAGGDTNGDGTNTGPDNTLWPGLMIRDSGSVEGTYLTIAYARTAVAMVGGHAELHNSSIRNVTNAMVIEKGLVSFHGSLENVENGIQACAWATLDGASPQCFVDATYSTWPGGSPSATGKPLACGAVSVSPWIGEDPPTASLFGVGNCDGIVTPDKTLLDSYVSYSKGLASVQIDCSNGFEDACNLIQQHQQCLSAATTLAWDHVTVAGIAPVGITDLEGEVGGWMEQSTDGGLYAAGTFTKYAANVTQILFLYTDLTAAYNSCQIR